MKYVICFLILSAHWSMAALKKTELRWDHFLSDAYKGTTQLNDYTSLAWDYKFHRPIGSFNWHGQLQGEYFLDYSRMFYVSAPELYLSYAYPFKDNALQLEYLRITFGRKIQSWSIADEYWEFGLWNPFNRWNPLHPTSKGLIGTFLNIKLKNWTIDMLMGGLYLPSTSVNTKIQNGQVRSSSRWFLGAPNKIDLFGRRLLDIEYLVNRPFLLDIFFQQSYILSFKTWLSKGYTTSTWAKWVFGYKPINDLSLVTNTSNILDIENLQVSQRITTLPVKHKIVSSEFGFQYNSFSAILSVGHTSVEKNRRAPEGWEFVHDRGQFAYFSALLRYLFGTNYVQLSFLNSWFDRHSFGDQIYDDTEVNPVIFNQYKILNGLGFDLHMNYFSKNNLKRQLDLKYKYSFVNKGGLLLIEAMYYFLPKLYTSITLNILGSPDTDRKYFVDKFRANDYIGWRIGYVF